MFETERMEFLKQLFRGGARSKKQRRRGGGCSAGSCQTQFSAVSSLSQGEDFAKMTRAYHGGRRNTRRHRGGAAELSAAFEPIPAEIHKEAGVASLDAAIADLSKFVGAPQTGGRRRNRTRRGGAMAGSPIDAPSMLLRPEDEPAAFLNPQWTQENLVNPNFHGPDSAYVASAPSGGARRKSRKAKKAKKSRKSRKGKKSMKGGKKVKKSRKSRKGKKSMKGGKRAKKSRKSRKSRKGKKGSRKH